MTTVVDVSASPLTTVLNDRAATRIGDPYKGTYHVRIDVTSLDRDLLKATLEKLGIEVTEARPRGGTRRSLSIYSVEGLKALLEATGEMLEEEPRKELDRLVRARGPIPREQLQDMRFDAQERGLAWVAGDLNRRRVVDGMGGLRWTAKKVKKKLGW